MDGIITPRFIEILLVEDNPGDARLTREAMREGKMLNRIHHVRDGVEALAFLRHEDEFRDVPVPDIILLDLNMPRKNGREVLAEIKEDSRLRLIPIVVLTTSENEKDIIESYELHANCYIVKPVNLERFTEIVRAIENFWLSIVTLPSSGMISA